MPFEILSLNGSFGREVIGLRLWERLDDRTVDQLRELWAHQPVLVFRRQALSEHELANSARSSACLNALFAPSGHRRSFPKSV